MQEQRPTSHDRPKKKKKRGSRPIADAISSWLSEQPQELLQELLLPPSVDTTSLDGAKQALIDGAPKRWVVYEPMVLLPSGSFAAEPWATLLGRLDRMRVDALWERVLRAIARTSSSSSSSSSGSVPLTHLAINEGIPLRVAPEGEGQDASSSPSSSTVENVLRSPSGLVMLYGDFGSGAALSEEEEAFAAGFWVSTKQNGIYQVWAPRWTMFSRGNVKEKARLLCFHDDDATPASAAAAATEESQSASVTGERELVSSRSRPRSEIEGKWAVDLYAGIGYFVFSYAKLGLRVLCWELNPWSVEGLRRGAEMNRWPVRVVRGDDLRRPTADVVTDRDRIVVFLEDNREAERRVRDLRGAGVALDVLHVNCGFLPSSKPTWLPAWDIQGPSGGDGWLHLHENVAVADIETRRRAIQTTVDEWSRTRAPAGMTGKVEHIELVKTFAPGVWHCVFDVYITKSSSKSSTKNRASCRCRVSHYKNS